MQIQRLLMSDNKNSKILPQKLIAINYTSRNIRIPQGSFHYLHIFDTNYTPQHPDSKTALFSDDTTFYKKKPSLPSYTRYISKPLKQ